MKRLFLLFASALVIALGYAIYLSLQSQDLSDLAGRQKEDRSQNLVDIPALIEKAAKSRNDVIITERQLNTWLATTLKARQEGVVADYVDISGVWVRFDETEGGRTEIIIEREVEGYPQTVSMFLRIERKKKEDDSFTTYVHKDGGRIWNLLAAGGRFGKIRVPQGFLFFTKDAFDTLAELFAQELAWMKEEITERGGGRIIFEENQMRIDFPEN